MIIKDKEIVLDITIKMCGQDITNEVFETSKEEIEVEDAEYCLFYAQALEDDETVVFWSMKERSDR